MNDLYTDSDPLWYKDAVIYQLHVKSFFDANNDGIGDFAGLMAKLDHVASLGVNTIWLLPFYPSPRRDDGYDIAGYRDVSTDYGTMADFRLFVEEAHRRDLKVITELVINHTSDQHPWFEAARRAPKGSPERDFYMWSDSDETYAGTRIIFCDTEKSNWTWDEVAGQYYWHRFYSHQPDLNFDNPAVLAEVLDIMHFWLDIGVDGLRLDAIPYLIAREGTSNENLPETHDVLKKIRADLDAHYPDRMLLAEANMWPEDTQAYFGAGEGDECHMAFHFPLMPRMYMAVAQEDRFPITDIMRQTPDIPEKAQWAIFLRNHDELTLEMVTDAERDYLWNTYAADRRARINLGIRRRLAPLMERDRRRIELMNALLLSMPGTPVLYYGDEIGMGDNIFLGDRDGVRTPMQWSPDRNGGFSRADPASLTLPAIQDPMYGYQAVNVETQESDRHSLLNWMKRMLAVRGQSQAFGRGTQRFLRPANRKILAYFREYEGDTILCVANLSRTAQAVELDLGEYAGATPVELSDEVAFPPIGQLPYLLTLAPYAFFWFKLDAEAAPPEWSSTAPSLSAEQHTFVVRRTLLETTRDANLAVLEDLLPSYVADRRWFAGKDEAIESVRVRAAAPMQGAKDVIFTEIEVTTPSGTSVYALPLAAAWEGEPTGPFAPNLALARVRRERYVGLLTDGFAVPEFAEAIVASLREAAVLRLGDSKVIFDPAADMDLPDRLEAQWLAAEQSNSTVVLSQRAVMKLLRRIQPGIHPEAEMTRHLTGLGFGAVPPLLGEVRREAPDGTPFTLMTVQSFVYNQGDGWRWTLEMLERMAADAPDGKPKQDFTTYRVFAERLGERLGEMHQLLARPSEDAAFAPEPLDAAGAAELADRIKSQLDTALATLSAHVERSRDTSSSPSTPPAGVARDKLRPPVEAETLGPEGSRLRSNTSLDFARDKRLVVEIHAAIDRIAAAGAGEKRTRVHGDLHLGQVLVAGRDVMLIDFEGEPARPLEERRAKDVPLRDVAGVLRSFDYAEAVSARSLEGEAVPGLLADFRVEAVSAFLTGYEKATGRAPGPLLDLYLLEKAAYEVNYEAANRPDWIDVPLAGLAVIAARLLAA